MKVSSTEIQNNFGKYLRLCSKQDIVITKNAKIIAKLIDNANKDINKQNAEIKECSNVDNKISYDEFIKLIENSEERYEYIDGEIYLLSPPKIVHQYAVTKLLQNFFKFFDDKDYIPLTSPCDITLKRDEENINIVQPDVMIISDLKEKIDKRGYYMGAPSLVVEIISESTRNKDYIKKLDIYMCCGIEEYWIINPLNQEVSIFQFEEKDIINNSTSKLNEKAKSFIFKGLEVELDNIFLK